MNKALIIGASGLIGSYLYKNISGECKTIGTFKNFALNYLVYLDINDSKEVKKILQEFSPDLIFLPAALTNVEFCEENEERCWKRNVEGLDNVVTCLKEKTAKLIFFSTDYIFDGKDGPYDEESKPNPLSVYGKSKLEGERIIRENLNNFLIIRTTCVFGNETQQKNFVFNLINKVKGKEDIRIPRDQFTTPTYAGDLAQIVLRLVREEKKGIYNIVGSNLLSRFEFALLTAGVFGLDKNLIQAVETKDLAQKARRPLKGGLKVEKIKRELGINTMTAKKGLMLMKEEISDF